MMTIKQLLQQRVYIHPGPWLLGQLIRIDTVFDYEVTLNNTS